MWGAVTSGHTFLRRCRPTSLKLPSMTKTPHVLIVDDHREIRALVSRALAKEGFRVSLAADGKAMRKVLADAQIDLILLDLMLPGESGLALCRDVRSTSNTPIIMVTAKGEEIDRVIGLELGADDYLAKPFGIRELLARIHAVLRRTQREPGLVPNDTSAKRYRRSLDLEPAGAELLRDDGVTCSVPVSSIS